MKLDLKILILDILGNARSFQNKYVNFENKEQNYCAMCCLYGIEILYYIITKLN